MLEARQSLEGLFLVDFFAGTGALGLEALSRGARHAIFVDSGRSCARTIKHNLTSLGLADQGCVLQLNAVESLRQLQRESRRFGLVLADPPYTFDPQPFLVELAAANLLEPNAWLVIEHSRFQVVDHPTTLEMVQRRQYGDTVVSLLRMTHYSSRRTSGQEAEGGQEAERE